MPHYPLRKTCKEVASLVVSMQDRKLSLTESIALRLHMAICKACPSFERQFLIMRRAMQQWRNYAESEALPSEGAAPANSAK